MLRLIGPAILCIVLTLASLVALATPQEKRVLVVTTNKGWSPVLANYCNGTYVITDLTAAGFPFDVVNFDKFLAMPLGNHDVIILSGHTSPNPVSSVQTKLETALQEGRKVFINSDFCYSRYDANGVRQEYVRYPLTLFNVLGGPPGNASGFFVVPAGIEKDPDITNNSWQNYPIKNFTFNTPPAMKITLGTRTLGFLYPNGGCMEAPTDLPFNLIDYGKLVSYLRYGTSDIVGFANDRIQGRPIASFSVHCDTSYNTTYIADTVAFAQTHNVPLINLIVLNRLLSKPAAITAFNAITSPLIKIGSHSRTHPAYWSQVPDVLYETSQSISDQRQYIPATGNYFEWSGDMSPTTAQMDTVYQSGVLFCGKGYDRRGYSQQSGTIVDVQRLPTNREWFYNNAACTYAPFFLSYTVSADYTVYLNGTYYLDEITTYFPRNVKYGMYTYGQLHDYGLSTTSGKQTHGIPMAIQIGWAMDYLNSQNAYFIPADELMLRLRDYLAGWIDYAILPDSSLSVTVYRPSAQANQVKIAHRSSGAGLASGSSVVDQHSTESYLYVDLAPETLSTFTVQFTITPPAAPTIDSTPDYVDDSLHASWSLDGPWVIVEYNYALGTSPGAYDVVGWTSSGAANNCDINDLDVTDGASYYLSVKARSNYDLWSDVATSEAIIGDLMPPEMLGVAGVVVDNEDMYVNCTAQNPIGRIEQYRYAVGSSPLSDDVLNWTPPGTKSYTWLSGLYLVPGNVYYVSAKAKDSVGRWSAPRSSSGLLVTYSGDIAGARKWNDGTPVTITEARITGVLGDCTYVESPDRVSGIKVLVTGPYSLGDCVDVYGKLGTVAGARCIQDAVINVLWGDQPLTPLGMLNRSVGGSSLDAYNPGVQGGIGLFNLGLLVKIWGKVTTFGSDYFNMSSGSLTGGQSPDASIKVSAPGLSIPLQGTYVSVVGISTVETVDSIRRPVIRVRDQSDIVIQHGP